MRSSFSVGQRRAGAARLELVDAAVVRLLEGLEGAHELGEGIGDRLRCRLVSGAVLVSCRVMFVILSWR